MTQLGPEARVGYRAVREIRPSLVPYAEPEEHIRLELTTAHRYALRKAYKLAGRDCAEVLQSVHPISRSQIGRRNLAEELSRQIT